MQQSEPTPRRRLNSASNISSSLAQLVEMRKKHSCTKDEQQVQLTQQLQKIDAFHQNQQVHLEEIKQLVQENRDATQFRYSSMYINLNIMLQRLPEDVVEELNLKFIQMTFAEIKKLRNA